MMFKTAAGEAAFLACYDAALAEWPVPYSAFHVDTRFGATHVIACGPEDGPPLVLLHAAGTGSPVWIRNVAAVSRTYRTFLVDTVGDVNKSVYTAPLRSRAEYVDWLSDVLARIGVERAHFGGMSYGGWQVLNFALAAPERVQSLMLFAPAASFAKFRLVFFARFLFGTLFPSRAGVHRLFKWLSGTGRVIDERLADQMFLGVKHFRFPGGGIFPGLFSDDELRGLRVSALLLVGDREVIYDPRVVLDRAKRLVPGIRAELVTNAGHLLIMEQAELVNQRIAEFLESVGPYASGQAAPTLNPSCPTY